MLLVVAHPRDEGAHFLTDALRSRGARLMVPRDLSIAGWRHYSGGSGEEWAVVSGERVHARDIRGAVVRLPLVRDRDLPHIDVCDREYAAAEMNSFLIAWLTGLSCPVLNRPTAASLLGPDFSHERWLMTAARAGLSIASPRRRVPDVERLDALFVVTVVADRWFGDVETPLGEQAVRLAALVRAELLTVRFDGREPEAAFVGAEPLIDPTLQGVTGALLARLDGLGT